MRPPGQACKPARPLKVIGERRASVEQCGPVKAAKHAAIAGGVAAILGFLVILATPADARVLTEKQETELTPSSKSSGSPSKPSNSWTQLITQLMCALQGPSPFSLTKLLNTPKLHRNDSCSIFITIIVLILQRRAACL